MAGTICFACREKGHAAKDCPTTKRTANDDGNNTKSKGVVGICYRCACTQLVVLKFFYISIDVAQRSTLYRDVKSQPTMLTLSHTHLALYAMVKVTLPHRARKTRPKVCILTEAAVSCAAILRIWRGTVGCGGEVHSLPNGYFVKLTRTTLDVIDTSTVLGTGREAGADEDDFHTFKRHTTELDRDKKQEDKIKRSLDVKAGAHSGVVKTFGNVPKPPTKKVVYF